MGSKLLVNVQMADGRHVAHSPYVLDGPLPVEGCDCPRPGIQFKADYDCSNSDPAGQIELDLSPFVTKGVTRADFDAAIAYVLHNDTALVHYTILDNQIYGVAHGKYKGFKKFVDEMLMTLRRRVQLPDVEFLLNMGDWPQAARFDAASQPLPPRPVFSWCGSDDTYDMVLPTYKMVQATVFGKDLENVQETDGKSYSDGGPWASKKEVLLFRGRPSNEYRTQAMLTAKQHPDLLDIRVTRNQYNYFPDEKAKQEHHAYEKKFGPKAPLQPFSSFFKNKYLLNIDGTVAAYRFGAMLAGNSLAFKQDSHYYEHFYHALKPWVHYVPVQADLSDMLQQVEWAKAHDNKAQEMMTAARDFARRHLRMEDIYCYHFLALESFAKLLKFQPIVHGDMELVTDTQGKTCACPKREIQILTPAAMLSSPSWAIMAGAVLLLLLLVLALLCRSAQKSTRSGSTPKGGTARQSAKRKQY